MVLNFNCINAAFLPQEFHFGATIVEWYGSTCVSRYGGHLLALIFVSDCSIFFSMP
jgi:hypothetical protein